MLKVKKCWHHIFWTTWGNSMKFSGKMCIKITLKVTKNQSFTLSLEDTIFEKPQRMSNWPPPPPPPPPICRFRVKVELLINGFKIFFVGFKIYSDVKKSFAWLSDLPGILGYLNLKFLQFQPSEDNFLLCPGRKLYPHRKLIGLANLNLDSRITN